ncbi:MAG: serine protease [Bacteroidetes bacterium]|nr:MAG: serine protease [Bacteroidota bacterium]
MTGTKEIIEHFRDVVVQIATPYATGTGFFLKSQNLIITNEHVVRGNRRVIVDGEKFDKQIVRVLYTDPRLDMAFLEAPAENEMPPVYLGAGEELSEGEIVIAVGHPFGLKYTATQGIISNALHKQNEIEYIQHDAALNPGNSGGPLIDSHGHVIGINTFIIRDGNNIGFSLPDEYLAIALSEYLKHEGKTAVMCHSCSNIVLDDDDFDDYCPHCGTKVQLPSRAAEYEPAGVKRTIESLLEGLGYNVEISRKGPSSWEITKGSAKINVTYHEKTGLIMGDAYLATLPRKDIKPIYEYLLRQNFSVEGLTFSIKGHDIILSLLIYDRYLNLETGKILFNHLFGKADDYDNILVEQYGASWKVR